MRRKEISPTRLRSREIFLLGLVFAGMCGEVGVAVETCHLWLLDQPQRRVSRLQQSPREREGIDQQSCRLNGALSCLGPRILLPPAELPYDRGCGSHWPRTFTIRIADAENITDHLKRSAMGHQPSTCQRAEGTSSRRSCVLQIMPARSPIQRFIERFLLATAGPFARSSPCHNPLLFSSLGPLSVDALPLVHALRKPSRQSTWAQLGNHVSGLNDMERCKPSCANDCCGAQSAMVN
jgi:hypothetical protein